jgi:hypothetical protein
VAALDNEIDRLYSLPLSDFIRERNAAASRLRHAGDADGAEEVKRLAKPTAAAWAINQAARRHRGELEDLLAAGKELRRAQREALGGSGAESVSAASRREREAVSKLAESAREILEAETGRPTRQTLDKIGATLRATTVDANARRLLEQSRLSEDLEPTGFGPFLAAVPDVKRTRAREERTRKEQLQQARQALKEARARERELRKIAAGAEQTAKRARREAEEAEKRAKEAAGKAEAASEQVAEAERELGVRSRLLR